MVEYFASHLWQMWLLVATLCLIVELTSGDFFVMCFSLGALVTAACSPFVGFVPQMVIFAVASVLCLLFVRPAAVRYLHHSKEERTSNADALLGREGIVTETIVAGGYGRVGIDGDDWKARSTSPVDIEAGAKVRVTGLESIILQVERM